MRNLLVGILLAGAAVSPALAQDTGDRRWHHDQQQNGRGEGRQQREQAQPVLQERAPRFNGGNFYRQQPPQFAAPQQQVQVQGEVQQRPVQQVQHEWNRQAFERRGGMVPQADMRQQGGPWRVEQNRDRGWSGNPRYRDGGVPQQQQVRTDGWDGQRAVQQQYRHRDGDADARWNRNWRNDERYDWRRYRDHHRSAFHLGIYIDPFGYGYQPFAIGYRLPPVYFGQQYWIDPRMYELPFPPPGTQWVRYWNDALLIDLYTGQVVDVIQGFFW